MKFAIEGQDRDTTIKYYKIVKDSIIIKFLDNSTCELDYSEENEQKIIDLMIKQAKFRDAFSNLQEYKKAELGMDIAYLISLGLLSFGSYEFINNDDYVRYIYATVSIVSALFGIFTIMNAYNFKTKNDEIKKYRMYLETEDLNSLDIYDPNFNINTLDKLTYAEVEERQKNVYKKTLGLSN